MQDILHFDDKQPYKRDSFLQKAAGCLFLRETFCFCINSVKNKYLGTLTILEFNLKISNIIINRMEKII